MTKTVYGSKSKVFIQAFIPIDVYDFLMVEKGTGSLSGYISALLQEYKSYVQEDEQKMIGINENCENLIAWKARKVSRLAKPPKLSNGDDSTWPTMI